MVIRTWVVALLGLTVEANSGLGAVTAFKALTSDPEIKFLVGPSWDIGGLPFWAKQLGTNEYLAVTLFANLMKSALLA